ncbi:MAG TPA: HEAT repeat domain-containing protein [Candidatus Omnitrophota bacterium]|nr:HEAT repeat domain-containing protein [Candidatus Omnitrophota bacterium]
MRYYCPSCWQDFWEEKFETCPKCGYSIKADSEKDYVDRLLNALNHPSGDVRHWVIMILVLKNEPQAIPHLKRIIVESKDPSLVMAAKEALKKILI